MKLTNRVFFQAGLYITLVGCIWGIGQQVNATPSQPIIWIWVITVMIGTMLLSWAFEQEKSQ